MPSNKKSTGAGASRRAGAFYVPVPKPASAVDLDALVHRMFEYCAKRAASSNLRGLEFCQALIDSLNDHLAQKLAHEDPDTLRALSLPHALLPDEFVYACVATQEFIKHSLGIA